MVHFVIGKVIYIFILATCIVAAFQSSLEQDYLNLELENEIQHDTIQTKVMREKRQSPHVISKRAGLGFFGLVGRLIFQQVNETASAYNQVSKIFNDQFLDSNEITSTTTINPNSNASTTRAPFKITREQALAIVARNIRGLNKLYRIEIADAEKQTKISYRQFRKQLNNEIAKSFAPRNSTT